MRPRFAVVIGVAVVVVLAATGCASSATDADPKPTSSSSDTTPTPTTEPSASAEPTVNPRGATYASLEEMRIALEAAGVPCPSLVELDANPNASESGFCEDRQWLLSTFDDIEARNVVLQLNVDSLEPGVFLAGPNWLLGSADIESDTHAVLGALQPSLGGVVWDSTQPFPS